MNNRIAHNFSTIKVYYIVFPILVLLGIGGILYTNDALTPIGYVMFQKEYFLFLNQKLSRYPNLQYNLTQTGDAFVILCMMSVFLRYAPRLWEALITASLISLVFSQGLKHSFDIPRPATIFGQDLFHIVGERIVGYSSFPSGHSITIFTMISVVSLAFLPRQFSRKALWIGAMMILGLCFAFTRVGVGAHHPIDVITGATLGYLSGILGILIISKWNLWSWMSLPKYYPFFIVLFSGSLFFMGYKMTQEHLPVFYWALFCLIVSLYLIISGYVQYIKK